MISSVLRAQSNFVYLYKMQCLLLVAAIAAVALIPVKADQYTEVVQTSSGPVRGVEVSFEGTQYKAFKGIPFAAPPVGDLRFKAPQPPAKWTEVRNATSYGKICFQPTSSPTTSEDCLTLTVYTPTLSENALKPVLFSIHGGGFTTGEGSDYVGGPEYLMQHDIVVVSITYRLGPIGFLATNSPDASGNWGMKDQVAALRWVQENIRNFGGNPGDVTIYGESAGGASVHLHLFSPLSKGLFHKAIPVSGVAINHWPLKNARQQEKYSRNLARVLGASEAEIEDKTKRVEFLRRSDAKALIDNHLEVIDEEDDQNPMYYPLPFTPVIESADTEGAFLTEDPKKMLAEGNFNRVPLMIGSNDLEGDLAYMGSGKPMNPETMRNTEKNVCQILPESLKNAVIAKNGCAEVAQLIRDAYFEGKHFDSSLMNFVYLFGDLFFNADIIRSQKLHARFSSEKFPVYNWYFTFDGQWNMLKKLMHLSLPGAGHGDDLFYMFKPKGLNLPVLPPTSREVITQKRFTAFIANFVKYGNPTPTVSDLIPIKWGAATEKQPITMIIGDDLKVEKEILKTRMDMWDKLYKKYDY